MDRRELAKTLAGIFWEVYGDSVRSSKHKDELCNKILNRQFDLKAFKIAREEIDGFYPTTPVVEIPAKDGPRVKSVLEE